MNRLVQLGVAAVVVSLAVPKLLHELTHAAVAAPFAERVVVEIDVVGGAALLSADTKVRWRDGASRLRLATTALGPSILGVVVGGVTLWYAIATGWHPPQTMANRLAFFAVAAWWLIYTNPVEDLSSLRRH